MVYDAIGDSSVSWAGKSYPDVNRLACEDGSVLVIPIGSLEQHGTHLPTATDTILVTAVALGGGTRVMDEVPILVTPPIWTGFSVHHLALGGTVSIDHASMLRVLEDAAETALMTGFDGLVLVNGHGGNGAITAAAAESIGATHPNVEVVGTTYFDLGTEYIDAIRDSDIGGAGHAGEIETSMIAHLRPELLTEDAEGAPWETPYDNARTDLTRAGPVVPYISFDKLSETGAVGSPELASAEKGERFYAVFVEEFAGLLRTVHRRALKRSGNQDADAGARTQSR